MWMRNSDGSLVYVVYGDEWLGGAEVGWCTLDDTRSGGCTRVQFLRRYTRLSS